MSEETFCKMKAGDIHLDGARRTSLKIWYEGKKSISGRGGLYLSWAAEECATATQWKRRAGGEHGRLEPLFLKSLTLGSINQNNIHVKWTGPQRTVGRPLRTGIDSGRWKRIGWGGPLCLVKRIESYLHWANLRNSAAWWLLLLLLSKVV